MSEEQKPGPSRQDLQPPQADQPPTGIDPKKKPDYSRYYALLGYLCAERLYEGVGHGLGAGAKRLPLDAFRLSTPAAKTAFRTLLDPDNTGKPDPDHWLAFRLEGEWLLVDRGHLLDVVVVHSAMGVATLDHAMPEAYSLEMPKAILERFRRPGIEPTTVFTAQQVEEQLGISRTTLQGWQERGLKSLELAPLVFRKNPETSFNEYIYRDLEPFLKAHMARKTKTI
jgi:hypothetical protein